MIRQSVFYTAAMDCPTEEQLIRNRLSRLHGVEALRFDLMARELTVTHRLDDDREILAALVALGMEPQRKPAQGSPRAAQRSVFAVPGMC